MGRGEGIRTGGPIVIPRLDDPDSASVDVRDEHLMLLEAARHTLEAEWTKTLAVSDAAHDHDVFAYPSTVAYLKDRLQIIAGRAHRYVKNARGARRFEATFSAWWHRLITSDQAELLFRAAEKAPEQYSQAETTLIETIEDDVVETKQILDYWQQEIDRARGSNWRSSWNAVGSMCGGWRTAWLPVIFRYANWQGRPSFQPSMH